MALQQDASDYIYSGLVSVADAIEAITRELFTWATVKLYYGTFYLLRAHLAIEKIAIFYEGSKPRIWAAIAGQSPQKAVGQTHQVVLNTHRTKLPTHLLHSQKIGLTEPMDWLMERREEANYTQPRFIEPSTPAHFVTIVRQGLRRSVNAYINDDRQLYTFDPDHAMLALPLAALANTLNAFDAAGMAASLSEESRRYVASLCADRSGPLNDFQALLLAKR